MKGCTVTFLRRSKSYECIVQRVKPCFCFNFVASCPVSVDFAFILDGSGSISRTNWGRIKEFVKRTISAFDVSPSGSHFALLEYSSEPKVYLRFNDFTDAQLNAVNVKRKVEEIIQSGGQTFIDKALILAFQEIFTPEAGMRPGVKQVNHISKGHFRQSLITRIPVSTFAVSQSKALFSVLISCDVKLVNAYGQILWRIWVR